MMHAPWIAGLFPAVSLRYPAILSCERKRGPCEPRRETGLLPVRLKNQLQRKLQQPRITNLLRLAKGGVGGTSVHTVELSVIEQVEDFGAKLEAEFFVHRGVFENADVPVVDRRIAA
jgi:hypothetical protein